MRVKYSRDVPPEDLEAIKPPDYRALVERVFCIDVIAYDWNCPQHITPRYTEAELSAMVN